MNDFKTQINAVSAMVEAGDCVAATVAAEKLAAMLEMEQLKKAHPLTSATRREAGAPTAEEVRSLLGYDPETGHFHWKKRTTARRRSGVTAGTTSKEGYVSISLGYKAYKAHRLAWLYVHGAWPNGVIDHINGVKGDNRISNLRETSQISNTQNRRKPNWNSASGILGVRLDGVCWRAQITVGGKTVALGTFETEAEAQEAYLKAKERMHHGAIRSGR